MVVGLNIYELRIVGAMSLKDKRRVLSSLLNRLRSRYNISVSEIDSQDTKQHAIIAVAVVANSSAHIYRVLATVTNFVEQHRGVELLSVNTELL
ncbi:MAG: DUF503 domain-containing protein [Thermoanaerobacteraceae bacterium]|nr:DUF503 domain-containing protein [Thermoanaerobacteraceae bacterium]